MPLLLAIFPVWLLLLGVGLKWVALSAAVEAIPTGLAYLSRRSTPKREELLAVTRYRCEICGYQWEQREDEPDQPVIRNEYLLTLGAERLRQEGEEIRRLLLD